MMCLLSLKACKIKLQKQKEQYEAQIQTLQKQYEVQLQKQKEQYETQIQILRKQIIDPSNCYHGTLMMHHL